MSQLQIFRAIAEEYKHRNSPRKQTNKSSMIILKTGHMAWFKIYNAEVEGRGETLVNFIIMEDYKITGIDFIFLQKTRILISRYLIRVLLIQQIQSPTYKYSPPMYAWLMAINREPPHAIFLTNLHRGNRSLTSLSIHIYTTKIKNNICWDHVRCLGVQKRSCTSSGPGFSQPPAHQEEGFDSLADRWSSLFSLITRTDPNLLQ